ncbi:LysM peptidoglycan-binding domain-containing protein [Saccharicrinis sp. FJH54]|uniref:LysM peptidoglycan-binding domain-containing protein n=1 Tax=Saccharicrinis sp. FJH54 TaxID=3344665 RepID=UPI0035D4F87E
MRKLIIIYILTSVFAAASVAQVNPGAEKITSNKIIENGKEFYLYKVKEREGFYTLERKFGVSRVEIVEYNPETANGLKLGQIIKIPVVKGRNSTDSELRESGDFIFHTVEKGQTLFFISRKYGVTEEEIFKYNPDARNILITGTELKIPVHREEKEDTKKNDAYIYHVVEPGETLFSIARTYNKPVKSVLEANPGLESSDIPVGSEVRVPKKVVEIKPPVTVADENTQKDSTVYIFEDSTYFYHKIKPKETFYSIISQYNVDRDAVMATNNIKDPENLKIGYIIKIPKVAIRKISTEQKKLQDKDHLVYKVKERRESLEDIADKFSVTVDQLKAANDNIPIWGRYRRGDLVRIPVEQKYETPLSVVSSGKRKPERNLQYERDSVLLAEAFIAGCDTQYYDEPVNVAVLWPFFLEANDTFNVVKEVSEDGDTLIRIKDPLEVYPATDKNGFREFYEGMLIAVDSLKRKGQNINLYTYDTGNDTNVVKNILAKPELKYMDLIIGPVYTNNVRLVSGFCKANEIKLVIPYNPSDELTINNPYVYQVNPFLSALFEPTVNYIVDKFKGSNIIVAYTGDKTESNRIFVNMLKRQLFRVGLDHYQPVSFKEVDVKKDGFQGLEKLIDPGKHNLVVLPPEATKSERMEPLSNVVPTIENLVYKRNMTNITLFGYPDFQNLGGTDLKMIFKSNTILYAPFYVNFDDPDTKAVISLFRDKFYTDPTAYFPYYGLLGFDVTYYFLTAIHEFGPEFDRCLPYLNLKLTTSGFNFQRVNNWSGMVNTKINFLNYQRNFDIVKLNYKPVVKPLDLIEFSNIEK